MSRRKFTNHNQTPAYLSTAYVIIYIVLMTMFFIYLILNISHLIMLCFLHLRVICEPIILQVLRYACKRALMPYDRILIDNNIIIFVILLLCYACTACWVKILSFQLFPFHYSLELYLFSCSYIEE